jgi:hypothetical protein
MTTRLSPSLIFVFFCAVSSANAQQHSAIPSPNPVDTTVCKILANPSAMNNRIVKVRGYLRTSSEYSVLSDQHCPEKEIWFVFADGSAPPQVEAVANGAAPAAASDSKARQSPVVPIHLIKDANYAELMRYLNISTKGQACTDASRSEFPPDCTTYRITATFTGRIDAVSRRTPDPHFNRPNTKASDPNGFGHMGMFEAQIVVQSVADGVAEIDGSACKPKSFSRPSRLTTPLLH